MQREEEREGKERREDRINSLTNETHAGVFDTEQT